jgi:hypothetical protein
MQNIVIVSEIVVHVLIKTETKAKCCHLKNWTVRALCGHTLSVYLVRTLTLGRGVGVEPERRLEGQQFTMVGRKYQHDRLYLQYINSDEHLPKVYFR